MELKVLAGLLAGGLATTNPLHGVERIDKPSLLQTPQPGIHYMELKANLSQPVLNPAPESITWS
jgi:hypothetical protein